jgi:hypothetical protein
MVKDSSSTRDDRKTTKIGLTIHHDAIYIINMMTICTTDCVQARQRCGCVVPHCDVKPRPADAADADAGSIPEMGIEPTAGYLHTVEANGQLELVGLRALRAGFRTFAQEFEAVVRR